MTITNVSRENPSGLPQELRTAQEAIQLPEVQEMLRRLAEYRLGIFMPHTHEEHSGEFQPLPDDVIQVESDLAVSFWPTEEIANHANRFIPTGWLWRAGASEPVAACEMVRQQGADGTELDEKHKMKKGN